MASKSRMDLFKRPMRHTALIATFRAATDTEARAAANAFGLSNVPLNWRREFDGTAHSMNASRYHGTAGRFIRVTITPALDATEDQIASVRNAIAKLTLPLN